MTTCTIFGGAGFIGTHLARHLLATKRFERIHLADLRPSPLAGTPGITTSITDVRQPIDAAALPSSPEWIVNLAAVHREPGHEPHEYFDTNIPGAQHVCDHARTTGCRNVYFTSSISVYGPTPGATDETKPARPITAYGGSKYPAEWVHRTWLAESPDRRLVICRPGVVYGPGDPGNILRMIKAIQKGYFAYPGSADIRKSYAYIYGMLDSIDFTMARAEPLIVYNYVETPTEPLGGIVGIAKDFLGSKAPVLRIPLSVLMPAAKALNIAMGGKSPIHPTRVKKVAMSTHIVPQWLIDHGFTFRYPFGRSLEHWKSITPADFERGR